MSRNRYSGTPQSAAISFPVETNESVTIDTAGTPAFSSKIPSSTLPELQDPQSPTPAMTKSALVLNSLTAASSTAWLADFLRFIITISMP